MRKVLFILGQLSDDDVEWLGRAGTRRKVRVGEVLVEQGRRIDALYIVLDGRLSVSLAGRGEIARLGSGEIIGEMSLIDARPPTATVTALEDTIVLAVPQAALEAKVAEGPAFAARFYRALATFLSDRMRGTLLRLGYGDDREPDEGIGQDEDELDDKVLDNVSLAGARFDRMLKQLLGASAPPGWPAAGGEQLPGLAEIGWSNRQGWVESVRLLLSGTPAGAITGFTLVSASIKDQPLTETFFALRRRPHPRGSGAGSPATGDCLTGKGCESRDHRRR